MKGFAGFQFRYSNSGGLEYCGLFRAKLITVQELHLVFVCGTTDSGVFSISVSARIQDRTVPLHRQNVRHMFYAFIKLKIFFPMYNTESKELGVFRRGIRRI